MTYALSSTSANPRQAGIAASDAQQRAATDDEGARVLPRIREQVDGLQSAQALIALFLAMRVAERNTDQAYRTRHDAMVFERGQTARSEKYNAPSHWPAVWDRARQGLGASWASCEWSARRSAKRPRASASS